MTQEPHQQGEKEIPVA